ncbi:MAG: hypothetical protein R6V01_10375, partial [Thermoplasmatota archaeon]
KGRLDTLKTCLGGEACLRDALEQEDVSGLSSIDGISERMAVDLILAYKGASFSELECNRPVRELCSEVQQVLSSYMHTSSSRNKVMLMRPGGKMEDNSKKAEENFSKTSLLEGRDRERMRSLLSVMDRKRKERRSTSLPYILVVEDEEAFDGVKEKGLDSRCLVIPPEELTTMLEGTIVLIHNRREMDEERLPIVSSVHYSRPSYEMVPETVLQELMPLRERMEAVGELRGVFSLPTISTRAVELMDELSSLENRIDEPSEIREQIYSIREELNTSLEGEISHLTLSGEDALSILSKREPDKLKSIYFQHARLAAEMVKERLNIRADLFRIQYPVEVDEEALERIIQGIGSRAKEKLFEEKVRAARELISLKEGILEEQKWAVDLDLDLGMACFVSDLDLRPFNVSADGFSVKGAGELMLRRTGELQPVDYHLGGEGGSRSVLLTGANSGGKTTLLMTVAQIVVMANMGLPVPAEEAMVPPISRLYIYRPGRRMDAGGLENFLRELLPLSLDVNDRSMVLADELEAMTELEAASRIIGVFVGELERRGSYSIIVTHMADEVLRFVDCRVDGIEARGLDDDQNLIVDRTPRIGHHARSTPELIIRRLEARAKGREKEIFSRVLRSF